MPPKQRKKNKKRAANKKCRTSPTKPAPTSDTTAENIDDSIEYSKLPTASVSIAESNTKSEKTVDIVNDHILCSKLPAVNTLPVESRTTPDITFMNDNNLNLPSKLHVLSIVSALSPKLPTDNISRPTKTSASSDFSITCIKDTTQCSYLPPENISFDVTSSSTAVTNVSDSTVCSASTENITSTETSTSPTNKKVDDADQFSKSLTESTLSADINTCLNTTVEDVDNSENITSIEVCTPSGTLVKNVIDPVLYSKFMTVKQKIPEIFLHKPTDITEHTQRLQSMGLNFKETYTNIYYTKIKCLTYDDKKAITQYFEKKKLPYHTYGDPFKRKIKVVIRGFPKDIDLNTIKSELKAVHIPIIRVHKMKLKIRETENDNSSLILAVVPCNDEGIKLLRVEKILGHHINLETPKPKTKQCHRCQLWGHTQRYCHGQVKCVKCAGDHFSKQCTRNASKEPPKCANCEGEHTANYRQCPCCPESLQHQQSQKIKHNRMQILYRRKDYNPSENCDNLNDKKHH